MNDTFYKIWLSVMAVIAVVLVSILVYQVVECDKQGGVLMRGMFTHYQCVLP